MENTIRIMKKISAGTLVAGVMLSTIPLSANAFNISNVAPINTDKTHIELDILWGNVDGEVQNDTETIFDGFVEVDGGTAILKEKNGFERHNYKRDRITSDENPVIWRSLIYDKYDGVKVDIRANPDAKVSINTLQGSMTLPIKTLVNARDVIRLDLGDGREIVVKVKNINNPTTPKTIDVVIGWGGPVDNILPIKDINKVYTSDERIAVAKRILGDTKEFKRRPIMYVPKVNFSGATTVSGNGKMKLISPFWFESNDKITRDSGNYISWDSTISGHFDGIVLRTSANNSAINTPDNLAMLSFKTEAGNGFDTKIALERLYDKGIVRYKFKENGRMYTVVMVALPKPVCNTFFGKLIPTCNFSDIKPVPILKTIKKHGVSNSIHSISNISPIKIFNTSNKAERIKITPLSYKKARKQLINIENLLKKLQVRAHSI